MNPPTDPVAPRPLDAGRLAQARVPGLLRRIATMAYDLMLVLGVVVAAAAVFVIPAQLISGETILHGWAQVGLRAWLLVVIVLYYVYFWSRGRQTLGMRAWRILLVRDDGAPLTGFDALRRLVLAMATIAPLGAGLLWALFDRDGLTGYDRLSRTRPVLTVKPGRAGST